MLNCLLERIENSSKWLHWVVHIFLSRQIFRLCKVFACIKALAKRKYVVWILMWQITIFLKTVFYARLPSLCVFCSTCQLPTLASWGEWLRNTNCLLKASSWEHPPKQTAATSPLSPDTIPAAYLPSSNTKRKKNKQSVKGESSLGLGY